MLKGNGKKISDGQLYKYKEAFSLRDEIGTSPNIEIEIDIMDKSPFYKTLPCKRRRQGTNRQRNEIFMLLRHIERRLFSLLKPGYANQQRLHKTRE